MSAIRDTAPATHVDVSPWPDATRVIRRARPIRRLNGEELLQAKLVVGGAGDVYEQEADRVADEVVRTLGTAPPVRIADQTATGTSRIQSNPHAPGRSSDATSGGTLSRSVQRKSDGAVAQALLADDTGTIRRAGLWEWMWGGAKTTGEVLDTGSAGMEAVDETHKAVQGLSESAMLAEGSMLKSGGDVSGMIGGAIGGGKDILEGGSQIGEEGLGVRSGLKVVGGTTGLLGAVNKGVGSFGGDEANELIKQTIGIGGEEIAGWLDFMSGGTKALSGAYLTGTSQLQYNRAKAVLAKTRLPEVKTAATTMMEIINERWYLGLWDMGMGTLDMAASYSVPGYVAAAKVTSTVSKMAGGDLLWSALSYFTGGKVRTNDAIDDEIGTKEEQLIAGADALARKALTSGETETVKSLYLAAKDATPAFAEKLSNVVKGLPRKEFSTEKQKLKGVVWS